MIYKLFILGVPQTCTAPGFHRFPRSSAVAKPLNKTLLHD